LLADVFIIYFGLFSSDREEGDMTTFFHYLFWAFQFWSRRRRYDNFSNDL